MIGVFTKKKKKRLGHHWRTQQLLPKYVLLRLTSLLQLLQWIAERG